MTNLNRYSWQIVGVLWVAAFLNYLDRQVLFSVLPLLDREMHLTGVQLGLLGTAFLWVYGLFSPIGGYAGDRFNRRNVILFSLAVWSLATFMTGHARTYSELLSSRILMGISEAFYLPAALALITVYHRDNTRAFAIGLHQTGLYAGIMLGGWGGGWLGEKFGWHMLFLWLGVCGILYLPVLYCGLPRQTDDPALRETRAAAVRTATFLQIAGSPGFFTLLCANGFASMASWFVLTWLPLYLYEQFHMSLALAGFSATFYSQIASLIGIAVGGPLADRWSLKYRQGRLVLQAIGLGLAGPFLLLMGGYPLQALLIPALFCFGAGRGLFDCNLMPIVCQIVSGSARSTAYGLMNFIGCFAGGSMALIAGKLRETVGLGTALELSGLLLIVASMLLLAVRLPRIQPSVA